MLLESESSASSNVAEGKVQLGICGDGNRKEQPIDNEALKSESFDHRSCAESALVSGIPLQEHSPLSCFQGLVAENGSVVEETSINGSSDVLKDVDCDVKLGISELKNADGTTTSKVGRSANLGDSSKPEGKSGPVMFSEDDKNQIEDMSMANTSSEKDPVEECVNSNMLINSDSSVRLPLYRDPIPNALLQKRWDSVNLGIRDDDENSFRCIKSSAMVRPYRPQPRTGQRRIRKILTSKYRKVAPKLKGRELYNTSKCRLYAYQCLRSSIFLYVQHYISYVYMIVLRQLMFSFFYNFQVME